MFKSKKIKTYTEQERQLHYADGELAGKNAEVGQEIMAYTRAARWFEKRVADDYRKKARNSRILAAVFGCLAFMSVLAVMMLTPLKTSVPYLVRVDKSSGYMDVVKPASEKGDPPEVIEDKHWIFTYVMARESYNWASQKSNYALVQQMSYGDVFNEYKNFQLSSKGYVAKLGQSEQVSTEIDSIIALPASNEPKLKGDKDIKNIKNYQVRLSQALLDAEGKPIPNSKPVYSVALISFDYEHPASTEGQQWLNPKGFGVQAYSKNVELRGDKQ